MGVAEFGMDGVEGYCRRAARAAALLATLDEEEPIVTVSVSDLKVILTQLS